MFFGGGNEYREFMKVILNFPFLCSLFSVFRFPLSVFRFLSSKPTTLRLRHE